MSERVCSSWSLDPDYGGDGLRFTCGCGEMTGVYPDHATAEAALDRHLDDAEPRIAARSLKRRRLPRFLRRCWHIRYLGR